MRRTLPLLALVFAAASFSGCTSIPTPYGPIGAISLDVQGPFAVTSNSASSKVGRSESTSVLGFAFGNASIAEAQRNGGISTIHHIDYEVTNILFLYTKYTLVVYGE